MTIKTITFAVAIAVLSATTVFAKGGGAGGGGSDASSGGGSGVLMAFGVVPENANRPGRPEAEYRSDCGWQFYTQSGQRQSRKDCSRRIAR